ADRVGASPGCRPAGAGEAAAGTVPSPPSERYHGTPARRVEGRARPPHSPAAGRGRAVAALSPRRLTRRLETPPPADPRARPRGGGGGGDDPTPPRPPSPAAGANPPPGRRGGGAVALPPAPRRPPRAPSAPPPTPRGPP